MSSVSSDNIRVNDEAAEAYRSLRATIKYATGDRPVRSVLVVDVDRDEPSGVARQLAASFASAGDRVALVDANIRAARGGEPGLTDVIAGSASLDDVTDGSDSGFTTLGPGTQIDPDLLAGAALDRVVAGLLEGRDYVVYSCASLPAHGDALMLASRVDAVILAVTAGVSRRSRAIEAREALQRVGGRLLGVVMVQRKRRWFM
jgi:Mrp family chromosome partitioning ATPase